MKMNLHIFSAVNPPNNIQAFRELLVILKRHRQLIVVCGHTIGSYAFIGAGAVVTKDVPNHALLVGNPAKQIGWVCECGEKLDEEAQCKTCGKTLRSYKGLAEVFA